MRPVVGNHEYRTPGAAGYFDYFNGPGVADGPAGPRDKGYYSYDLGAWHVVALNSQCSHPAADNPYAHDCAAGSAQEQWLRADLAAHPARCTLAVLAPPAVQLRARRRQRPPSSRCSRRSTTAASSVLLTGHDHGYERFAPMDAGRQPRPARAACASSSSARAARTTEMHRFPQPNSEVREDGRSACSS